MFRTNHNFPKERLEGTLELCTVVAQGFISHPEMDFLVYALSSTYTYFSPA